MVQNVKVIINVKMILTVSITVLQKKTCAKYAVEGAECETSEDPNLECQKGFTCVQYGTNTKKVCVMNYSLEDGTSIASTSSDEGKDEIAIYGVTLSLFHPLRNLLVPIQLNQKNTQIM